MRNDHIVINIYNFISFTESEREREWKFDDFKVVFGWREVRKEGKILSKINNFLSLIWLSNDEKSQIKLKLDGLFFIPKKIRGKIQDMENKEEKWK